MAVAVVVGVALVVFVEAAVGAVVVVWALVLLWVILLKKQYQNGVFCIVFHCRSKINLEIVLPMPFPNLLLVEASVVVVGVVLVVFVEAVVVVCALSRV